MSRRLKIQCWNCPKTYFETLDTTQEELIVQCPFCNTRGKVSLRPYRKQNKTATIYRKEDTPIQMQSNEELQFPDVLPSRKPE